MISASEIIRKTALIFLVNYENGIRFSDLKFLVEERLSDTFPPDDKNNGKFRSALWDLDKRYSEYVKKEKQGNVSSFIPTQKLISEKSQIHIPDYVPTVREKYAETLREERRSHIFDRVQFKSKIMEVIEFIESRNIDEIDVRHFADKEEMKCAVKAMIFIEGLKELKYHLRYVNDVESRY
jgi:hypothetical protein